MAEVLGLVASVVTLAQVVAEGVSRIKKLLRAPEQIEALQEQLDDFRRILRDAEATAHGTMDETLSGAVSKASKIVEDLRRVVDVNLLARQDGVSDRARRTAWVRNKAKVVRLRNNLREAKESLVLALVLSSSRRFDRRLGNIENVLHSHSSIHITKVALSASTMSLPSRTGYPSMSQKEADPPTISRPAMELSDDHVDGSSWRGTDDPTTPVKDVAPIRRPVPASSFELSPSFTPGAYKIQPSIDIIYHDSLETQMSDYYRDIRYAIFFRKGHSQWIRVTLRITTSIDSLYWDILRTKSVELAAPKAYVLPTRMDAAVKDFLRSQNLGGDCFLNLNLGVRPDQLPIKLDKQPHFNANAYLQQITDIATHMDCPWYYEKALDHCPLSRSRQTIMFVVYLESRWVLEFRFGSEQQRIDSHWYILQVLHCLSGRSSINPLVGLVLDDRGTICSFLCEVPAKGDILQLIAQASRSGQPIAWERRERWCRQIVKGLKEIHSQGFVHGSLGESMNHGVHIDADDNVVLYNNFRRIFTHSRSNDIMHLPPEYYQLARVGDSASMGFTARTTTDIYQLGLILWLIASHKYSFYRPAYCEIGCIAKTNTLCTKHPSPIQLPSLSEDTPAYLINIIAACRFESPNERLPAKKLLKMFPPITEENQTKKSLWELEEHLESVKDIKVNCNKCGHRTTQHYFHCKVCDSGDFDLCPDCVSQGVHCLEADHYLWEDFGQNQGQKYYTSVRGSGQRDIIAL